MTRGRQAAWASTVVGLVIVVVCVIFLAGTIADRWEESEEAIRSASVGWLCLAFVLAAAGMTLIALPWGEVLGVLGAKVSWGRIVVWYYVGEIGKYLPGGLWPLVGRGELAARGGVRRTTAYASVALSLLMLYTAAMVAAGLAVPVVLLGGSDDDLGPLWVLALLPLALGVLHPSVLVRLEALAARLLRRELHLELPGFGTTLRLVASYLPAWAAIGSATWAVSQALGAEVSVPRVLFATILSWIVGFVVVPVPGGVGVRESAFVAASGLPAGLAATVAIAARLVFVLVDSVGAGLGATAGNRAIRRGVGESETLDDSEATTDVAGTRDAEGSVGDGVMGAAGPRTSADAG